MTIESNKLKLTQADLEQFTGTEGYYRYSLLFPSFLLTDGTKFVAENSNCFWLFDKIAALQLHPKIKKHPELKFMQFWTLTVHADKSAILICDWDKGKTVYEEKIARTDFPLHELKIWVQPEYLTSESEPSHFIAFLPSEY